MNRSLTETSRTAAGERMLQRAVSLGMAVCAVALAPATANAQTSVAAGGTYLLKSGLATNLCMDASGGQLTSGTRLQVWTCHGRANQQFVWQGNGEIRTTNGLCVDSWGGQGNNHDPVKLHACHGGPNQRWSFTSAGQIKGMNGRCIDVDQRPQSAPAGGTNSSPGTPLIIYSCHNQAQQRWSASPVTAVPLAGTLKFSPASGVAPLAVTYGANLTGGAQPVAVTYSFGDGTSATQAGSHTYSKPGNYVLTMTAKDARGQTVTTVGNITVTSTTTPVTFQTKPQSAFEAARFLTQATFGATAADVQRVQSIGYTGWLDEQFGSNAGDRHVPYLNAVWRREAPTTIGYLQDRNIATSFYKHIATNEDQLRQRVGFALSEIVVLSTHAGGMAHHRRGVGAYLDMLNRNAFGNYRDVLEGASRSPAMANYLTFLKNRKPNADGTRQPDQNFAREIMQLFSIGVVKLNQDGTPVLVNGQPVETYDNDDIEGLSHVFTGLSWGGPDKSSSRFYAYYQVKLDDTWDTTPLEFFPQFHSTMEKRFLGKVIPASSTPNGDADLKFALDTIFNHPNVGPYIGKQLIQRLVTSNPSPQYVYRVAQAFNTGKYAVGTWSTGSGRRGDLGATIAAVLLDTEARDPAKLNDTSFGKVREPVLRITNWMRAFRAAPTSGEWYTNTTTDAVSWLSQQPLRAPSVFNFFRPGYTPPNTALAERKLVAPEMQIADEVSVAGYASATRQIAKNSFFNVAANYSSERALAHDADKLIDRINLLFMYGTMTANTRMTIRDAVNSIAMPTSGDDSVARDRRVRMAVWLAMSAPEFLVQQ